MAAKQHFEVKPDLRQYRGLINAMNKMSKQSTVELKDEVRSISLWVARSIKMEASASPMPKQAEKIARTVTAKRDRMPSIVIGGSRQRFKNGTPVGVALIGAEMGATSGFPNGGRRHPYRSPREGRGNRGYWIFPTVKALQPEITRRWKQAVERYVFDEWNKGSGGGI